ncbi:MAG: metallophosphoesterase [Nitrospirales bacterium]|nr:metallophosphoesterase [Nitrospirales bacterium]
MRVVWATDIHLNFLGVEGRSVFFSSIRGQQPDAVLVTGDIAEAPSLTYLLHEMRQAIQVPLYFVLGNHDFYYGSISQVRKNLKHWCESQPGLIYLSTTKLIELNPTTGLVGHDGWGDGRYGNYHLSPVRLSDQELIADFQGLDREAVLAKLGALGDEAAGYLRDRLDEALESYQRVICLTHVPPFKEACWYQGKMGSDDWLPYFAGRAVGEVLLNVSRERPDRHIIVLCGHTHHAGIVHLRPNLRVITGSAEYGTPCIQDTFDLDELFTQSILVGGRKGRGRPSVETDVSERQP